MEVLPAEREGPGGGGAGPGPGSLPAGWPPAGPRWPKRKAVAAPEPGTGGPGGPGAGLKKRPRAARAAAGPRAGRWLSRDVDRAGRPVVRLGQAFGDSCPRVAGAAPADGAESRRRPPCHHCGQLLALPVPAPGACAGCGEHFCARCSTLDYDLRDTRLFCLPCAGGVR